MYINEEKYLSELSAFTLQFNHSIYTDKYLRYWYNKNKGLLIILISIVFDLILLAITIYNFANCFINDSITY